MRKLCRTNIQSLIKTACRCFMEDDSSPDSASFLYKGHYVNAYFEWSPKRGSWYLSYFDIFYSRCKMRYRVNDDFDLCFAWCW